MIVQRDEKKEQAVNMKRIIIDIFKDCPGMFVRTEGEPDWYIDRGGLVIVDAEDKERIEMIRKLRTKKEKLAFLRSYCEELDEREAFVNNDSPAR